jgi:glycosyltransferase involved in cell wall biosynthesis
LVAFLGRFISIKNVERLVEAFTRIEGKMIRLVLAGDGPLRDRVLDLIDSKNWKTKPLYVGYLDREGIGRMLCASDALAVPSLHEPWGVVVNEALHLNNVCLVTSGVCAGRDLIIEGTNGTFVDPLSIESIADGLVRVHEIVKDGNYAPANLFLSNLFSAKNAAAGILAGAHLGEPYLRRPPGLDRLNPQAHSWVAHLP